MRNKSTWRWILATAMASLLAVGASSLSLRALAQQSAPEQEPESNEEPPRETQQPPASESRDELPPELRDSADNNQSFPIDI